MKDEIATIGYVAEDSRWKAVIQYQVTDGETRTVIHDVEEIEDLQELVENGPTFCAIVEFKIEYLGAEKETILESMGK